MERELSQPSATDATVTLLLHVVAAPPMVVFKYEMAATLDSLSGIAAWLLSLPLHSLLLRSLTAAALESPGVIIGCSCCHTSLPLAVGVRARAAVVRLTGPLPYPPK